MRHGLILSLSSVTPTMLSSAHNCAVIPPPSHPATPSHRHPVGPVSGGADAAEYKPERFTGEWRKISPFKYTTFQAGPRICLGQDMAYFEATLVLAMVVRRFDLTLVPGTKVHYQESLTLPMKAPGLPMTVTVRPLQ